MKSSLAPDDLFALRFLRDGHLACDGRRVAYAVSATRDGVESFEVRILDLLEGRERRLPCVGNATAPRWSPDGQWLAFSLDGVLHVAEMPSLKVLRALTPTTLSLQGAPSWSPDGTQLAVTLLERRTAQAPRRLVAKHFRSEGLGFVDGLVQRLWVVDRNGETMRPLTETAQGFCSQPEWSLCGRRILFMASESAVPFSSYSPRLMTVDVGDGAMTVVLDERWYIAGARWLPDARRIAVAAVPDSTLTAPNPSLWVVDLHGKVEQRTPGLMGKIGGLIHHDMPAWELTQRNPLIVLDGKAVLATILNRGSMEVWRIALEGDIAMHPVLRGEGSCIVLDASAATNTLLYAVTSLHSPTELWRASLDGGRQRQISDLNGETLVGWPTMEIEQFSCTSADGLQIDAWSMAAERKRPLPTVLFIHGGPFAATGNAFRYDFHLLASHGFGIVFSNFRGSAGYGDAFTRSIMGDWGGRGFPDHMATIDAAIARQFADAKRLGVWGPSHGGFATCWIVGHTHRFKAAVAEAASTDFTTFYHLADGPDVIVRELGGRPHEIPDVYRACSPLTYAHRCTTPTLFIHGENDLRCPISEAEQFYRVLHDVGCPTELVRIPDCDHLGDSCGPVPARQAQNEALLDWFKRHL